MMVDGGLEYLRYGWPNGYMKLKPRIRYVNATRKQLHDDWNKGYDKFGIIMKKGAK
jgi:hypothetical protein